jgi:hypothetical protein
MKQGQSEPTARASQQQLLPLPKDALRGTSPTVLGHDGEETASDTQELKGKLQLAQSMIEQCMQQYMPQKVCTPWALVASGLTAVSEGDMLGAGSTRVCALK